MIRQRQVWRGTLAVSFEISSQQIEGGPSFVHVAVLGEYQHDLASILPMLAAAALANPFGAGFGLIFDFSNLNYRGGDGLLDWVYSLTAQPNQTYYLAVVSSPRNRGAIDGLIADLRIEQLANRCFGSLIDAQADLLRTWQAEREPRVTALR